MAKNRFAQPLYGKIIYIFETDLKMEELSTIFSPKTYWIDVTGIDCEVGYIQEFREGEGIVWVAPPNEEYTFEELKANKIELLKATRDNLEVEPIEYNGNRFDYDEKARDRINAAIIALDMQSALSDSEASLSWTTADNTEATVTANDLRGVIANVAVRSNILHVKYRELKELVEAAETAEDLEAIVW